MEAGARNQHPLAGCHGFAAITKDGCVGEVETPLFAGDACDPDYLVVRIRRLTRVLRPVVPAALVASVDSERRIVCIDAPAETVLRLPEHLPLAM